MYESSRTVKRCEPARLPKSGRQREPLKEPLNATLAKPRLIFLDTCYLISLANSNYSIRESLERLKQKTLGELVVTEQVLAELKKIASSKRMETNGRNVLDGTKLTELYRVLYSELVSIERIAIEDSDREEAKRILEKGSAKGNCRVGEGELSIFVLARQMRGLFSSIVLSIDSDVGILMDAC